MKRHPLQELQYLLVRQGELFKRTLPKLRIAPEQVSSMVRFSRLSAKSLDVIDPTAFSKSLQFQERVVTTLLEIPKKQHLAAYQDSLKLSMLLLTIIQRTSKFSPTKNWSA